MAAQADDPNKTYTLPELMERGQKVYSANCAVCHQPNGKGGGPFPALDGSKIVNGPLADHVSIVLHGKNAMPNWSHLSDVEIASVITFERNSWGNKTGDILQPRQVKDARSGKMPEGAARARAPAIGFGELRCGSKRSRKEEGYDIHRSRTRGGSRSRT